MFIRNASLFSSCSISVYSWDAAVLVYTGLPSSEMMSEIAAQSQGWAIRFTFPALSVFTLVKMHSELKCGPVSQITM